MNKVMKKLLCACLALAMLITVIPSVTTTAQAAKTEKLTLYKGEAVEISSFSGTVKSVSSSKKSVVSVAKDKKYNYQVNLKAKKAGTSTVTIKTTRGTTKYTITVKKLDITAKFTYMRDGYLLMTVKNNTKQTFTSVAFDYVLKNDQGATFKTDTATVSDVVAGKTVYAKVYYDNYTYTVDPAQCSVKAVADRRSLYTTYKNVTSKIKTSKSEKDNGNGSIEVVFKTKNKQKKNNAYVTHYVLIYNSMNQVIGLSQDYEYLKAGKMNTGSVKVGSYYYGDEYDHYKVVTVAYSSIY